MFLRTTIIIAAISFFSIHSMPLSYNAAQENKLSDTIPDWIKQSLANWFIDDTTSKVQLSEFHSINDSVCYAIYNYDNRKTGSTDFVRVFVNRKFTDEIELKIDYDMDDSQTHYDSKNYYSLSSTSFRVVSYIESVDDTSALTPLKKFKPGYDFENVKTKIDSSVWSFRITPAGIVEEIK